MATELDLSGIEYEVTKDNGFATIVAKDENIFVEKAKEAGIEKKTLEQVSKFRELYLNAGIEANGMKMKEVMEEDKDIKEGEVTLWNGLGKSTKIKTHVLREKTMRIPGDGNKTITKSVVKNVIESREFVYPKSKRKDLEAKLTSALLSV